MTTFVVSDETDRVESITVTLHVTLANRRGEHVSEMTFSEFEHGRETVNQLADLLLNACALARAP